MSPPVLVAMNLKSSRACHMFKPVWDEVIALYPHIRSFEYNLDINRFIDPNIMPRCLKDYTGWFPNILLIPGTLWDEAMKILGPNNPIEFKDNVQILNARFIDGKLEFVAQYSWLQKRDVIRWLDNAIAAMN